VCVCVCVCVNVLVCQLANVICRARIQTHALYYTE